MYKSKVCDIYSVQFFNFINIVLESNQTSVSTRHEEEFGPVACASYVMSLITIITRAAKAETGCVIGSGSFVVKVKVEAQPLKSYHFRSHCFCA